MISNGFTTKPSVCISLTKLEENCGVLSAEIVELLIYRKISDRNMDLFHRNLIFNQAFDCDKAMKCGIRGYHF